MRSFVAALSFHTLYSLSNWRWWLVPILFGVAGFLRGDNISFSDAQLVNRSINVWDALALMHVHAFYLAWLYVLGFVFVIGDNVIRERDEGMIALTFALMPSRTVWWIAKLSALGILALCYVGIGLVFSLLGSVTQLPFSWQDSPAALSAPNPSILWYERDFSIPMPLFVLLINGYIACMLWVIGCIVMTVSLLVPKTFIPFGFIVLWILASFLFDSILLNNLPYGLLLDVSYFVSYAKHFDYYIPLPLFILIICFVLGTTLLVGMARLRSLDV
ncbi:MAG: hypothetical protein GFH27_549289n162 [Chloroflexi bacterium AL-W]|nr:hypothetical protein [Chloroflexi bacterium AL-N1]NOK66895.1 hypothetical protein [Chloroflexi bacterium AL-N10]NOK74813.1 hypothetical protein [Chloroflexi bacterium AL-N5]NOK81497.1 hypothetical protein [Chloroflexi bacterium AL-W]NOK88967.1 hypothetical protein [Chloroflexi bacterium AL-N15]